MYALIIAAHPDDAELAMGGTIAGLKAQGKSVAVLDLTDGEPTPHGTRERRAEETAAATRELGIDWRRCAGLPNRSVQPTLEARRAVAAVIRELRPQLLFAHYWQDAHPDHVAACEIAETARFWSKLSKTDLPGDPYWPPRLLYFHSLHLKQNPHPSFILDVSAHYSRKLSALACYRSQFVEGRVDFIDSVRDRGAYWGALIGVAYGEPFSCREELGLTSLEGIL